MAAVGSVARPRSGFAAWLAAARPRTLPAAVAPVVVGTAVAVREGTAHAGVAAAALATALLLQVGANLANDVFDYERGADREERLGPVRATQAGWIRPRAMRVATAATFALAASCGLVLVARGGWPLAVVGVLAVAAGLGYSGGPWPFGYHGLGDAAVFVFFGLVGVAGTAYVQALALSPLALVLGAAVGLLAAAILTVNNLRDLESDRRARKRTLAVRLGRRRTLAYYAALLAGAEAIPLVAWAAGAAPAGALLALASLPEAVRLARRVARAEGAELNPLLAATARLEAVFALLVSLGLLL